MKLSCIIFILAINIWPCNIFASETTIEESKYSKTRNPLWDQYEWKTVIHEGNIFQINKSKQTLALSFLGRNDFVEISEKQANWYVADFTCHPNDKPFLVKAIQTNEDTGIFTAELSQHALYVHHSSHGDDNSGEYTVLIINLDNAPKKVVSNFSVAK